MTPITAMTFNIRLALDSSLQTIAERIVDSGADVVALQEVGRHWTMGDGTDQSARLAEMLGFHGHFAPALFGKGGDAQYGIATLSRWPIATAQQMLLPRAVDEQRSVLFVELSEPFPFTVINTHLSVVPGECERQWPHLLDVLSTVALPWVCLGDFNFDERSAAFAAFARRCDPCGANAAPSFPAIHPTRRIDHLFASTGQWDIVDGAKPVSLLGSDHLPVRARLLCRATAA